MSNRSRSRSRSRSNKSKSKSKSNVQDTYEYQEIHIKDIPNEKFMSVAIRPNTSENGSRIFMTSNGTNELTWWDLVSCKVVKKAKTSLDKITNVKYDASADAMAVAGANHCPYVVFDMKQKLIPSYMNCFSINAIAFSPNNRYVAVAGTTNLVHVHDYINKKRVGTFITSTTGQITSMVFHNNTLLLYGSDHGEVKGLVLDNPKEADMYTHDKIVNSVASNQKSHYASGSNEGSIIISYHTHNKNDMDNINIKQVKIDAHLSSIGQIVFHPTNDVLISSSADTTIKFWNIHTGKNIGLLQSHKSPVRCIDISHDAEYIVSGDLGGRICVWGNVSHLKSLSKSVGSIPTKVYNFIDLEHTPHVNDNGSFDLFFKAGNDVFEIAYDDLIQIMSSKSSILFECKPDVPTTALTVQMESTKSGPYININKFSTWSGLLHGKDLERIFKTYKKYYRKKNIVSFKDALVFKLVPTNKKIDRVVSLNVIRGGSAVSALHCNEQEPWTVYKVKIVKNKNASRKRQRSPSSSTPKTRRSIRIKQMRDVQTTDNV